MEDAELDRQIREGQSERIIFVKSSGATDVPKKQEGYVQSPGHVCNDLGTGHRKNVKTSMAAREMKTHTSSGSSLAAKKLKDIQKPNKRVLRRARRRKRQRNVNAKSHAESHNKFGGCFRCGKKDHRWQQCFKRKKKLLTLWKVLD
ncbi:unnamed protein product [Arabis nemorensis]|uniref:Uncharacterized protein n=1 Tax=Arabis nemorensis TaxID=586526 RepID=A0A565CQB5_9BRAS|nr:unnamed protein product [Arabis nemorensis]